MKGVKVGRENSFRCYCSERFLRVFLEHRLCVCGATQSVGWDALDAVRFWGKLRLGEKKTQRRSKEEQSKFCERQVRC